ncbi:hypothetical protein, partial [Streptomyces sp. B188M101]
DPATAADAIRLLRERDAGRAAMLLGTAAAEGAGTRPHHVPEQPGEQTPVPEGSGVQTPVPEQSGEQTPTPEREGAPHPTSAVLPGQGGTHNATEPGPSAQHSAAPAGVA